MSVLAASFLAVTAFAWERTITVEQLPKTARTFISTHFPDAKVAYAEIDDGKYEVKFSDGSDLEFRHSGDWEKVDCKRSAVPQSVLKLIPASITTYVGEHFPDSSIVKVDKERYGYEIELNNGLELKFRANGDFLYIDD